MPALITDWHPLQVLETMQTLRGMMIQGDCTPSAIERMDALLLPFAQSVQSHRKLVLHLGCSADALANPAPPGCYRAIDLLRVAEHWSTMPKALRAQASTQARSLAGTLSFQYGLLVHKIFRELVTLAVGKTRQEADRLLAELGQAADAALHKAQRKQRPMRATPRCKAIARKIEDFIKRNYRNHQQHDFIAAVIEEVALMRKVEQLLEGR
jgi:hypothetical protein